MKNMKRQAVGVRRSSDELENTETSDCKRIKLVNSESNNESAQDGDNGNKSTDLSCNDINGSPNHNHEDDMMPVLTQNGSVESNISNEFTNQLAQPNQEVPPHINGNDSIDELENNSQNSNELMNHNQNNDELINRNESDELKNNNQTCHEMINNNQNSHELANNNQNESFEEVVLKSSSTYSGIVSELYYSDSQSSSAQNSEKNSSDKNKSIPVHLNHENLDANNDESTDSFQSESIEPLKVSQSKNKRSGQPSSQEQDKSPKVIFNSKSDLLKSFDVDNLTLSHLEVTQLEGHPDVIYAVAADEDFVLSSSGDTTVKVWSTIDKSLICNFSGHSDSVTSLLLLNQSHTDLLKKKLQLPEVSRIAITGSLDCQVKLWSVFEGKELLSMYTFNGITCLGYLESEQLVVVGTEGGKLELWDIYTSKVKQSVRAHEDAVSDIKVHDCNIYSVSTDGAVKIWLFEDEEIYPVYTRKRRERLFKNKELGPAQWKAVATSNNIMYLGDSTNCIKVLDSTAGRLRLFRNQAEEEGICECVASEKDFVLTSFYDSSSDSGGINVLAAEPGLQSQPRMSTNLPFWRERHTLVAACLHMDTLFTVWKIPDMTYICTLSGEVQDINSLAIVRQANSLRIVTGGLQLLVWDFDFSKAPNKESQTSFQVTELESVGQEISENLVEVKNVDAAKKSFTSNPCENNNRWCNVM